MPTLPLRSAFRPAATQLTGALLAGALAGMSGVVITGGALAAPPPEAETPAPSPAGPGPVPSRSAPAQASAPASAPPQGAPSPRMAVSPDEIIVTPGFLPSREELAQYHDEQYRQLKTRYEPDPPPKTRGSTLLGEMNVAPSSTRGPSDLVNCPDIAECTPWGKPK